MKKLSVLFCTLTAICTGPVSGNSSTTALLSISDDTHKLVDNYVSKTIEQEDVQGAAYAVLVNGKLTHQAAFGFRDSEAQKAVSVTTVFPIASITKLFVSSALQQLLIENSIPLDTSIGKLLNNIPSHWSTLTITQLLSHTSGLPDYYRRNSNPQSKQAAIDLVDERAFRFSPNDNNKYNQTGFLLLHLLIEKLSGVTLEQYLRDIYFSKLNLNNTFYVKADDSKAEVSKFYKSSWFSVKPMRLHYPPAVYASAGLNASLEDLTVWMQAFAKSEVIPISKIDEIRAGVLLNDGSYSEFSLGWEYQANNEIIAIGHSGADTSQVRQFFHKVTGESVTVIWLSNTLGFYPDELVNKIGAFYLRGI